MRDSPTPGRHRSTSRRRGLIGPIVSALSVLLAVGPVVWVMTSQDGSTVANDDPTKVLNVSADNSGTTSGTGSDSADQETAVPAVTAPPTGSITTPNPTVSPGGTPAAPTTVPATITPNPQTSGGNKSKTKPRQTPTTTATQEQSSPLPPAGGGGTNTQERQVLDLTNAARRQNGCGPLSLADSLVEAAGQHASDMVRRHYMDHNDPDGKSAFDRMETAGFHGSAMGENIAAGYDTAQRVFAAWMQSDGHRKNILNCNYNKIGIGYDPGQVKPDYGNGSWVEDFGRS